VIRIMRKRTLHLEEGWSTLILLLALLLVAAVTIMQADLTSGTHVLPMVAITAVFIGLFLAKSRFKPKTAHFMALIYGFIAIGFLVGTTLPDALPWHERIPDLLIRQFDWIQKVFSGGTSRDGLVFVLQTAAVFWLLGYTAAWYTFRKPRVWRVVLPTGLVLLSIVYYYYGPKPLLYNMALYIVLALLFIARTHLIDQEAIWRTTSVRYEQSIRFNFMRAGLVAALVLLSVAYVMPTFAANTQVNDVLGDTRGPWRDFQETWTRMFAALRAYGTATADPYQDSMALGGPRSVSNDLVMDIYVPRELPNLYWRAIPLDTYKDGAWTTGEWNTDLRFPDDGYLPTPKTAAREIITQTVVNYIPNSSFLYAAPEIIGSSRQMFVDARADEAGNQLVSAVRSRFVLALGDQYEVVSRISNADEASLRAASTEYPAWVRETYLQLPDSLTPATLALAAELTAPYDNVYDKATAVQNYLRENIAYNDQIEAPPPDAEPIDYTLFESKEAYCTYYASAMAMMLRAEGIPTRIVNGYAQGDFDEETTSYRVRASNAHTWVEVYFPEYGWIQFEPTASIPVVVRRQSAVAAASTDEAPESPPVDLAALEALRGEGEDEFLRGGDVLDENQGPQRPQLPQVMWWERIFVWQTAVAAAILTLALLLTWAANRFNKRIEEDVERSYTRLETWAHWLGLSFHPANTPYERADLLAAEAPEGKEPIRRLTRQFVLRQFSPAHENETDFNPRSEWQTLRPLLLRKSIRKRLQRLQKKPDQD
jgi:transglutaminase-like putative cysteine protease